MCQPGARLKLRQLDLGSTIFQATKQSLSFTNNRMFHNVSWVNGWLFPKQKIAESDVLQRGIWVMIHMNIFLLGAFASFASNCLSSSSNTSTISSSFLWGHYHCWVFLFCFSFGIVFLKHLFPCRFWAICDKGGT